MRLGGFGRRRRKRELMRGEVEDLDMVLAYGGYGFGGCAIPIPSRRRFYRIDVICEVRREDMGFFPSVLHTSFYRPSCWGIRSGKSKYGNS